MYIANDFEELLSTSKCAWHICHMCMSILNNIVKRTLCPKFHRCELERSIWPENWEGRCGS